MRLLIDNALSPGVAAALQEAGHDAVHVRDRRLQEADDEVILRLAVDEGRVLITADTDFAALLALEGRQHPSIVQFRRGTERHPDKQVALLLSNLPALRDELGAGAIVTIERDRIRLRRLES